MFKTTYSLDKECYYFLFQIALLDLQNGKGVVNLNQILKSSINFMMDKKDTVNLADFEIQHIIKTDKNNYIMYFNGEDEIKNFLVDFSNQLSQTCNFELKNNQIIKSIVIFYYKYLLTNTTK